MSLAILPAINLVLVLAAFIFLHVSILKPSWWCLSCSLCWKQPIIIFLSLSMLCMLLYDIGGLALPLMGCKTAVALCSVAYPANYFFVLLFLFEKQRSVAPQLRPAPLRHLERVMIAFTIVGWLTLIATMYTVTSALPFMLGGKELCIPVVPAWSLAFFISVLVVSGGGFTFLFVYPLHVLTKNSTVDHTDLRSVMRRNLVSCVVSLAASVVTLSLSLAAQFYDDYAFLQVGLFLAYIDPIINFIAMFFAILPSFLRQPNAQVNFHSAPKTVTKPEVHSPSYGARYPRSSAMGSGVWTFNPTNVVIHTGGLPPIPDPTDPTDPDPADLASPQDGDLDDERFVPARLQLVQTSSARNSSVEY